MASGKPIPAREAAYLVLRKVDGDNAYANLALKKFLDQHTVTPLDSRLAAEIVYGTCRMRYALDHILSRLLTRPMDQLMPEALTILRLSIYQLHYLEKAEEYAVVDEGVKLTKKYANPALAKMVNGVLRNYLRKDRKTLLPPKSDLRNYLHKTLSYPQWLTDMLIARYGAEAAEAFCHACNKHQGIWLRANTLKNSREELLTALEQAGVSAEPAGFASETVRILSGAAQVAKTVLPEGRCIVQGPASQLVAHALAPKPGSRVMDLCAAPGGKTTHLAAMMEDKGELHAFDIHEHKIQLIRENCERLGIHCVKAEKADSACLPKEYKEWADYVLLDAPCSGLGVLAERPDSRHHKLASDIPALASLSRKLLEAAAGYVRPGGYLCYSTCTITKEENTDQIRDFLARHSEFSLVPMDGLKGLLSSPEDRLAAEQGQIQLMPFDQGMEGFYIALLQKK